MRAALLAFLLATASSWDESGACPATDDLQAIDRVAAIARQYESTSRTLRSSFEIREWRVRPCTLADSFSPERGWLRSMKVQWLSSGPCWRAEVQETISPPGDPSEPSPKLWTEYWDGETFYGVVPQGKTTRCQFRKEPPRGGLYYDVLGLFNRWPGRSILGRASMADCIRDLVLVERRVEAEGAERLVLAPPDEPTYRLELVIEGGDGGLLREATVNWLDVTAEGEETVRMRVSYETDEWGICNGRRLPARAHRAAFARDDEAPSGKQGKCGYLAIERGDDVECSDEPVRRASFRPEFEAGWHVHDFRLRLIYTIGEMKVEIDDVLYETSEPMHPSVVDRLSEIIVSRVPPDSGSEEGGALE